MVICWWKWCTQGAGRAAAATGKPSPDLSIAGMFYWRLSLICCGRSSRRCARSSRSGATACPWLCSAATWAGHKQSPLQCDSKDRWIILAPLDSWITGEGHHCGWSLRWSLGLFDVVLWFAGHSRVYWGRAAEASHRLAPLPRGRRDSEPGSGKRASNPKFIICTRIVWKPSSLAWKPSSLVWNLLFVNRKQSSDSKQSPTVSNRSLAHSPILKLIVADCSFVGHFHLLFHLIFRWFSVDFEPGSGRLRALAADDRRSRRERASGYYGSGADGAVRIRCSLY